MYAFTDIRRITSVLELAESIRDQACALFRTAQREGLLPGRSIEAMAAGCVYAVVRCNGLPRTVAEVAEPAPVDRTNVEGAYRVLNAELGLPAKPLSPSAFVPRISSALGVSDDVQHRALRLAAAAEEAGLTNGVQPSGFAGGCLYKALEGRPVPTQCEVASAADTSRKTVRKHRDTLNELGAS
jgi:transcription initiation factor TFIIB